MESSQDRLKQILSDRRNQIPADDYFRTVLPEFHRRLRIQTMSRKSLMEMVLERFHETFSFDLSPGWRYAATACVAAVACGVTLFHPTAATPSHLLTLESATGSKQGVEYSLADAADLNLTTKFDQQLDHLSMNDGKAMPSSFVVSEAPARYVLTNHPVTYDTVAAF
jgi:hypothetical protein